MLNLRVKEDTPQKLKEIAKAAGFVYADEGRSGTLLDAIAAGEFILIKRNPE